MGHWGNEVQLRHPGLRRAAAALAAAGLLGGLIVTPATVSAEDSIVKQLAKGALTTAVIDTGTVLKNAPSISPGTLAAVSATDIRQEEADSAGGASLALSPADLGVTPTTLGCRARNPDGNVRVNQDCTFRRQAEELIKINPSDPSNIIAGQNDSRIGFNKCGFDYSFDSGATWGDGQPPFMQRINSPQLDLPTATNPNRNTILDGQGTDHTYDAASDPAIAFDSQNRAFYSCVVFDVNTNASGILVTQSPAGAGGSFYDNVSATGRAFVVVEDNAPIGSHEAVFHDKEFITADFFASSPNRDNVYVTWTVFEFNHKCGKPTPSNPAPLCASPIFGSMSTNHGVTWSTPEEISGTSGLCSFGNAFDRSRPFNACDFDQGSDPQVQPDGSLAVVFFNENTVPDSQQLAVVCHPGGSSTAGTAHLNCGAPSKVGDDISTGEPQCDFGRGPEECVPGPWIRTNDFPRIGRDPTNGALYAVWQDYRNKEFDIQVSRSVDNGHTWTSGGTVNPTTGFDHYMPAVDVGSGNLVAASYYQSQRVANENTTPAGGFAPCRSSSPPGTCEADVQTKSSSYWLAGSQQSTPKVVVPFVATQISPSFPPPDGAQAGFNGDYSGLAVTDTTAHPVWSDTRNAAASTSPSQGVTHDEDIFTTSMAIPH
jgi:hypothetical protein